MTANLLTLNSSKTKFLLIGHKKQLDKIHNSSLNTTNSARNLGVSSCWQPLMNILLSPTKFRPSPKLVITILDSCDVSVLSLIPPQLAPFPPPSFSPDLITVILSYTIQPTYRSQITRLQQIQNSLARAVVKAAKSCHITPILRSLHWFKITERIEYKLLSLTYKVLTTTQPPYLHNLISAHPLRSTGSSSLVTLARPTTLSSSSLSSSQNISPITNEM